MSNAIDNVLKMIFPDFTAGGKKPSGGGKGKGSKKSGNPGKGGAGSSRGAGSRGAQKSLASFGAQRREMSPYGYAGESGSYIKPSGPATRPGSYIEPSILAAKQGAANDGKQGKSAVQERGADGLTEGEKAADAATMNSETYDQNGYTPKEGDNDTFDVLNKRIKDDIASGKLKFADGYDSSDVDWLDIAMGDAYSNPFASYGTKDYARDGMMYTNLSDDAQKARSDYLYSLYNDPDLAKYLGDTYLGDSRAAWDQYFDSTMNGDTMADVINNFGTTGHQYTGGDDAMVQALVDRIFEQNDQGESLADYITIDGTPLSNMELSGGTVDNEAMEAAMLYMLDQQLDAVNSGDVNVEDLGYSISDLNKLARAENLLYTPGTEQGANTKDHRGNPVEGAGFDDEWIKRISSEDGRYGAGRTTRAIPVKNFADDMFQAYDGLGYLDYDDVSDETRKRYGRG